MYLKERSQNNESSYKNVNVANRFQRSISIKKELIQLREREREIHIRENTGKEDKISEVGSFYVINEIRMSELRCSEMAHSLTYIRTMTPVYAFHKALLSREKSAIRYI